LNPYQVENPHQVEDPTGLRTNTRERTQQDIEPIPGREPNRA
jgi:hypothetical protein